MKKPKLSFWQIWNLSFGFLGVQIGYSLQNSNTSTIFESLGADLSHLSYFWLAAPVAGLIIQPIVGLFSDGTWTRLGRRVPFILGGAVISVLALALMPNAPLLLAFAPLAMGAFILLFMDLSFNVTMQPFRALVADMLDDSQKTKGYVVQTFLINLGAVVGAVLPLILTRCGVSDEVVPGQVADHIAWSYYIGGAILLATVLVTAFKTKEYPPEEFSKYQDEVLSDGGEKAVATNAASVAAERVSFVELMRNIPRVMWQLGIVQFFSWAALFLMWTYLKPAITGVATVDGAPLSEGEAQTWVGVLNGIYPVPACIASLFIAGIAARWGNKSVYALCLLCGAAGFAGLCLLCDKFALMLPMVGIGIAWAGILAMPYAILSRAVDARRMGVYMGIFNFTITVPQIVVGLTGGVIVTHIFHGNPMAMIALAGFFMACAAASVCFIKEK
ncbi:MAG: MFS transporter [Alistipes senegalensis]|nr:MFS transporter [Bacteroides cellulosilyticus]MCM1351883.1 MFS transporter [Alistipes senegalensis]